MPASRRARATVLGACASGAGGGAGSGTSNSATYGIWCAHLVLSGVNKVIGTDFTFGFDTALAVATDGRVTDGLLAHVARLQEEPVGAIGPGPHPLGAQAGLDVLFGQVGWSPVERRRQSGVEGGDDRLDRDLPEVDAERFGDGARIVHRLTTGEYIEFLTLPAYELID